jgi:hypothetical protein
MVQVNTAAITYKSSGKNTSRGSIATTENVVSCYFRGFNFAAAENIVFTSVN